MEFIPLKIKGVFLIEKTCFKDERGVFYRQFCKREFEKAGIAFDVKQINVSINPNVGTLRGLHVQRKPYEEAKIISCVQGRIFDVLADVRPNSPTYLQWIGVKLSGDNRKSLYCPPGVAHGFQTLCDQCIVCYLVGEFYTPEVEVPVRWNDPKLNIKWPECAHRIISQKDANASFLK